MNNIDSDWSTFLNEQGAVTSDNRIDYFKEHQHPSLDIAKETFVSPLTQRNLLIVAGPDAFKFLQGQVTCDVEQLRQSRMVSGAHCTHKGRMVASFRAMRTSEQDIALSMDKSCMETLKASLAKYIVFSKAKLISEQHLVGLGVAGKNAGDLLRQSFPEISTEPYSVCNMDENIATCIAPDHFECWLTPQAAQNLWNQVKNLAQPIGETHWDLLCIRQGLSEVRAETVDMFIPQMLNLEQLNGISYKKGCYTGQEVVARMTYLGKLKRHTYRAAVACDQSPKAGTPLYTQGNAQSIGNIVVAAQNNTNEAECLICVTDQAIADDSVYLDQTYQQKFQTLSLPYAINRPEED